MHRSIVVVLFVLGLVLSACGSPATPAASVPTAEQPNPTSAPLPVATEAVSPTAVPATVANPMAGLVWRIGSSGGLESVSLSSLLGLDVGADGTLYAVDGEAGVLVISPDSKLQAQWDSSDFYSVSDVKVGPDGTVYVADWGKETIYAFSPAGEKLRQFGEQGQGDGQFAPWGYTAPEYIAVCPDGRVYAADDNEDSSGNSYERVEVFDAAGQYLSQWNVSAIDSSFEIAGMDCGPDGKVYLAGFDGGYVMVFDGDGQHLEDLGYKALSNADPQGVSVSLMGIAIGPQGKLYLGTWNGFVAILDSQGNLLAKWGTPFGNEGTMAEGQVFQVRGIAVDGAGNVYFSDQGGSGTYITKFVDK
jgi:DNA-binding beta-propeller fold protein YncE